MPIQIRISYQYRIKYAMRGVKAKRLPVVSLNKNQIHVMEIKTSVFSVTSVKFAIIKTIFDKKTCICFQQIRRLNYYLFHSSEAF